MTNIYKRVLNLEDVAVQDQSGSGYVQSGGLLIQFGTESGGANPQTVTLPTPFATASYSVVATAATPAASGTAAQNVLNITAQTTTTFDGVARNVSSAADADDPTPWNWIAIGVAP